MLGNIVEASTGNYKYYYTYTYSGELALKTDSNGNKITYNEDSEIIKVFDNEFQINYNNDEEELFEEYDNLKVSYDEIVNDDGIKISDVIVYTIDEEEFLRKTINYDNYNITSIAYCYSDKKVEYHYTYTLNGNLANVITKYYNLEDELEKTISEEYTYDSKNQLSIHKVFENNIQILDVQYVYDGYGNIQKVTRNIHSNEYLELPGYEEYIYDNVYKDLLITKIEKESVNGVLINTYNYIYDSTNSNLTAVKNNDVTIEEYTYEHRNLITYINEETRIEYKYNSEGIRYQKDIYDKQTNTLIETRKYFLDGIKIIAEEITKDNDISVVYYRYNQNDEVIGYTYETKLDRYEYTYIKNYQGDILGIIDNNGIEQTNYIYDAYGRVVSGNIESNSLLYRSYYYDTETSYYYLNSRYYNPQNTRFQIADDIAYLGLTDTVNSYNLFSYCEGEPVNKIDYNGYFAENLNLNDLSMAFSGFIFGIMNSLLSIKIALKTMFIPILVISSILIAVASITYLITSYIKLFLDAEFTRDQVYEKIRNDDADNYNTRNNTVYVIYDKETLEVWYVGRTNNFDRRKNEHYNITFPKAIFKIMALATGLTHDESRVLEQALITAYGLDALWNSIKSGNLYKFIRHFARINMLIISGFMEE